MIGCENGICGAIKECILAEYCANRRTNTLPSRAELAESFDLLGAKCPQVDNLSDQYKEDLANSRIAQQEFINHSNPFNIPLEQ